MNSKLSLAWQLSGAKEHPVILFLHGFMGSGDDWENVVSSFEKNFRCLTVDLPGHGRTALLNRHLNWKMENTAAAVVSLLKKITNDKCFLVGYSMGGRLALYLALQYPNHFAKVVLESASPGLKTAEERKSRNEHDERLAEKLEKTDFTQFLSDWYQQPLFREIKELPRLEEMFQRRLNNHPQALAKSLREMGTGRQPSLWKKLSQNKIPLFLVVGEKDSKFRSIADEMVLLCSAATVEVIQNCGHNVHFEEPAMFAAALEYFLST